MAPGYRCPYWSGVVVMLAWPMISGDYGRATSAGAVGQLGCSGRRSADACGLKPAGVGTAAARMPRTYSHALAAVTITR